MDLAFIIPFHNEERSLPNLIRALRSQIVQDVPIVFIDNASSDRSTELIRECEEVRAGKWSFIEERRIGKFHALKTAISFCQEQFGAANLGFIDADSYPGDPYWSKNIVGIREREAELPGYIYSPITYFGFDRLPTFKEAFLVYDRILRSIVENVGWLANGQGFVCATDILAQYFENAEITTEFDLRCSLLALAQGRKAHLNPSLVISSGRRIVVNSRNFATWCFYGREYYSKKDINARRKLDLNNGGEVEDLHPTMVRQFFKRRAMKIASRHLMPFAIFGGESSCRKVRSVLGIDVSAVTGAAMRQFRENPDWLLTSRFETMIRAIEIHPATIALAGRIAGAMSEQHDHNASCSADLRPV